jgi:hypothetical protein
MNDVVKQMAQDRRNAQQQTRADPEDCAKHLREWRTLMGEPDEIRVLAIDPGSMTSGYVIWDGKAIDVRGNVGNHILVRGMEALHAGHLVVERGFSHARRSLDTDATVLWVGRFMQRWIDLHGGREDSASLMSRSKVSQHLYAGKPKDVLVRKALIARFGEPGKKGAPGLMYGLTGDAVQAFALAVAWYDLHCAEKESKHAQPDATQGA